jgi:hypothetical protein
VDNQHLTGCELQSKLEFFFKTGKAWHALHELEKADSALTQATQLSTDLVGQTADADGGSSILTTLADAHILHFFTLWKLQQWVRSSAAALDRAARCVMRPLQQTPTLVNAMAQGAAIQVLDSVQLVIQQVVDNAVQLTLALRLACALGSAADDSANRARSLELLNRAHALLAQAQIQSCSPEDTEAVTQCQERVLLRLAQLHQGLEDFSNCAKCLDAMQSLGAGGIAALLCSFELALKTSNQQRMEQDMDRLLVHDLASCPMLTAAIGQMIQSGCATGALLRKATAALRERHADGYPGALVAISDAAFNKPEVHTRIAQMLLACLTTVFLCSCRQLSLQRSLLSYSLKNRRGRS